MATKLHLIFYIVISLFLGLQTGKAQEQKEILLSDSINLSDQDIKAIFFSYERDTLGFSELTANTSLNKYKGTQNRHIMRTLKSIKKTMDGSGIYDKIAGKSIASIFNVKESKDGRYLLNNPKYMILNEGVLVIGKRLYVGPWTHFSDWIALDCYFVGFDKSVQHIKTVRIDTRPKRLPIGIIEITPESVHYNYPDSLSGDTTKTYVPPQFLGGMEEFCKFVQTQMRYPEVAIEDHIQGRVIAAFTVNPDKSISDIKILRGVDALLDRECLRVVKQVNQVWRAGLIDGVEVPVEVILPVIFRLRD